MSALVDLYMKIETLETIVSVLKKKGEKGIKITVSINNDVDEFGNNAKATISQSKEERESKKKQFYVGNGKCFWTDGKIEVAKKEAKPKETEKEDTKDGNELPF